MKAINDLGRHTLPLRAELLRAFETVLDAGHFILGNEVSAFEREFAAYVRSGHCIAVGNGTDALELAMRACGIGSGDAVATVANAGLYGTTAIRAINGRPVYADIDPATGLVHLDELEAVCRRHQARAIIVTHLYGRMVDMPAVRDIARANGCFVVEDCAQAHGAVMADRPAGSWGDVGCFSFYPTKNLGALGDAGAVVTGDEAIAARLRQLRQYGWRGKYDAELAGGRNSRMDELQAAVLRRFLPRLDHWNERRRAIAAAFDAGIRHGQVRSLAGTGASYVAHLYVIRCSDRAGLRSHLGGLGIPTDVHYPIPDHRQAASPGATPADHLAATDALAGDVLTLPCFPEMDDAEVTSVITGVNSWMN